MSVLTTITTYPRAVAAVLTLTWLAAACLRWRWPLLVDSALIALYAAWPSLPLLFVGAAIDVLRWLPVTSRELAVMVGAEQSIGATRALWRLVLAGWHQETPGRALPPLQAATGATTRLEAPQAHARPLSAPEWFAACNDDPTAPHLGIIGPTQHGKTTFALALAGRRLGEFVITTTKDDTWSGGDVIRPRIDLSDDAGAIDWQPVIVAINRVHREMLRRNLQHDTTAPPLTLIIDEFTTTLGNVSAGTKKQILEIWSMGASCGVRTIVIAQEVNARAWSLEGRRDLLSNLLFARVSPGMAWSLGRLDPNGGLLDPQSLDTDRLVTLAAEARLAGRGWRGGAPSGSVPGGVPAGVAPPVAQQTRQTTQTQQANGVEERITLYMKWRAAKMTREVARALRQSDGSGLDDAEWAEAGKRLASIPHSDALNP